MNSQIMYSRKRYSNMLKLILISVLVAVCYGQETNTYFLFTPNNKNQPETMAISTDNNEGTLTLPANSKFIEGGNTIYLIHDHGGSASSRFNTLITEAILIVKELELNVIVVDWRKEASFSYAAAMKSVPLVAENLAKFIIWLTAAGNVPLANQHLVGFGLGAHVAGITARQLGTTRIGRITGLDPSGSGWNNNPDRLKNTDATYVEVILTDSTGIYANGIGSPIGDINIYPNGGSNQPGCFSHSCNHDRAYELFAASIFNTALVAQPCSSITQKNLNMCRGNPLPIGGVGLSKTGTSNVYRINTRRSYPF